MIKTRLTSPCPRPTTITTGVFDREFSRHGLNLALKAVRAREVREESQAASAAVAARLDGQLADRDGQVARARGREKLKRALLRAARPEVIYGDAVKEANLRGLLHAATTTSNNCVPLRKTTILRASRYGGLRSPRQPPSSGERRDSTVANELRGWKVLQDAQSVEARAEEDARREALRNSKEYYAAFLASQEQSRRKNEVQAAREYVAEGRRLVEDAAEHDNCKRKDALRARRASRELCDSRRAQVEENKEARLAARRVAMEDDLREVEKIRALDRADAWEREQGRRAEKEKNRLNKEENDRLMMAKAAERQEKLRDEHRMQLEYAAKMDADEERKKAELRKMQQRQTEINQRMTAIYELCKAGEDCCHQRAEEENKQEMRTAARRGREKEEKRVQLGQEQKRLLKEQERLFYRRLGRERQEDLAAAAEAKERNREMGRRERADRERRREEARRVQRLLEVQIAGKVHAQALQRASGGMDSAERTLNKTLLLQAAVTMGLAPPPPPRPPPQRAN